jgi:hypothetical protein
MLNLKRPKRFALL